MRRLGRQHGNVLCFKVIPRYSRSQVRIINEFHGPPTTARLTRAPAKPTNHSRYTSRCGGRPRCGGCHHRPADKARSKTKRARKLRSHDAGLNHGLFFHNVMGPAHVARFGGVSATEILDFVYDRDCGYDERDDERDDNDDDDKDDCPINVCACYYYCNQYGQLDDADFYFVHFESDLEDSNYFVKFESDSEDDEWCLVEVI